MSDHSRHLLNDLSDKFLEFLDIMPLLEISSEAKDELRKCVVDIDDAFTRDQPNLNTIKGLFANAMNIIEKSG